MLQVSQNIINVFCTDRKPNGVRMNAACQQFFFVQLRMGCGCRMDHQALNISNICQQGEEFQTFGELLCLFCIALNRKGENRTCTVREVLVKIGRASCRERV